MTRIVESDAADRAVLVLGLALAQLLEPAVGVEVLVRNARESVRRGESFRAAAGQQDESENSLRPSAPTWNG